MALIVALVVLGPERLPKVARTVGRWVGQARRYMRDLSVELERETQLGDIKRQMRDVQKTVDEAGAELNRDLNQTATEVSRAVEPSPPATADDSAAPKP